MPKMIRPEVALGAILLVGLALLAFTAVYAPRCAGAQVCSTTMPWLCECPKGDR